MMTSAGWGHFAHISVEGFWPKSDTSNPSLHKLRVERKQT